MDQNVLVGIAGERKKIKVLIIEDNLILCDILSSALESAAMEADICSNSSYALDIISRKAFDVFIADYGLPRMNGAELVRVICSAYPESRIIGISVDNH